MLKDHLLTNFISMAVVKTYSPSLAPRDFIFTDSNGIELIRMAQGKFYWKGKEVKDTKKVYERFNTWLTRAKKPHPLT